MNLSPNIITRAIGNNSAMPLSDAQRIADWSSKNAFVTEDQRIRDPINEAAARCQIMGPDALLKMLAK
jgi:hypothetical protein